MNILSTLISINENIYFDNYIHKDNDYPYDWYSDSAYVVLPRDANGTVTIKVNNSTYKTLDVIKNSKIDESDKYLYQKIVYCYFKNLKMGKYNIEVTYKGNYGMFTKTRNATVDYHFDFYEHAFTINKDNPVGNMVFFILPDDIKGNIKVYIDGVDVHYDITKDLPGSITDPPNFYDGSAINPSQKDTIHLK